MAFANAGGKGGTPAAATGTITAPSQSITAADQPTGITEQLTGLIRTNIPLQPGDSGGPLVSPAEQMIGMDNTAASSQFQITSGTAQAFAIPASQTVSVAAQIVAARLRRRSTSAPSPCSASPSCRMASRCRASEPAPGQASSKLQPGPRPPQPTWPWRRDRVAGRARRHVSSRPPVGDRCVPPREQDQRGLGRPGRPDLHSHRGLGHLPGRLSYRPPSAVQAHEAETRTHGRAGRGLGLYCRAPPSCHRLLYEGPGFCDVAP